MLKTKKKKTFTIFTKGMAHVEAIHIKVDELNLMIKAKLALVAIKTSINPINQNPTFYQFRIKRF